MDQAASSQRYYPAFLELRGRQVVVVGGGEVALRKVESLLAAGARVRVVAPEIHPAIEELAATGEVSVSRRPYEKGDLAGAMLAIAATSIQEVNRAVAAEAEERRLFLNVVDAPQLCSFIVPSVIRRDDLTVAISTGGLSPALAKQVRLKLEEMLLPEYGAFLRMLGGWRSQARRDLVRLDQRERFWSAVMNSDAFDLFRSQGEAAATSRVEQILLELREDAQPS